MKILSLESQTQKCIIGKFLRRPGSHIWLAGHGFASPVFGRMKSILSRKLDVVLMNNSIIEKHSNLGVFAITNNDKLMNRCKIWWFRNISPEKEVLCFLI